MSSLPNKTIEREGDVTQGVAATADAKLKLPAEQEHTRKRLRIGSLHGIEESSKDHSTIDTSMEERDDTLKLDEEDHDLESDEEFFEQGDGVHGEDEENECEDDKEDYNEFEKFAWLEAISMTIKATDSADSPEVGYCTAKLIDRE